jgi:hypothetical protein
MQCLTIGNIGQYGRDQIVNITGQAAIVSAASNNPFDDKGAFESPTSGGTITGKSRVAPNDYIGTATNDFLGFNASNAVNTGDRVQPRHIQFPLMMVVATAFLPASQAQYSGFVDSLAGKIDLPAGKNQSNIDFVIESATGLSGNNYINGWYRKYKNGWVEQGGESVNFNNEWKTISLPVTMANDNYFVSAIGDRGDNTSNTNVGTVSITRNGNNTIRIGYALSPSVLFEVKGMYQ